MENSTQGFLNMVMGEILLEEGLKLRRQLPGSGLNFEAYREGKIYVVKCATDDLQGRINNELAAYNRLQKKGQSNGHKYVSGEMDLLLIPYIEGQSLEDHMKEPSHHTRKTKRLSIERCVYLAEKICERTGQIHEAGVVHADMKPDNIIVERGGVALIDFGFAAIEGQPYRGDGNSIYGTPHYTAPETWYMQGSTPQGDIYGIGIILYEMLNGYPPFVYRSSERLRIAHEHERIPDIKREIPKKLMAVIKKAVAKHPSKRFQSAKEMKEALQKV